MTVMSLTYSTDMKPSLYREFKTGLKSHDYIIQTKTAHKDIVEK